MGPARPSIKACSANPALYKTWVGQPTLVLGDTLQISLPRQAGIPFVSRLRTLVSLKLTSPHLASKHNIMDGQAPVWYFAYGSNLSPSVMARRGITPLDARCVRVSSHMLIFDVFGVPYSEPAMAGIREKPAGCDTPAVHGVAYLISASDYQLLRVTEGAGTGYRDVELEADSVSLPPASHTASTTFDGGRLSVATLVAKNPFDPPRLPSRRYMVRILELELVLELRTRPKLSMGLSLDGGPQNDPHPHIEKLTHFADSEGSDRGGRRAKRVAGRLRRVSARPAGLPAAGSRLAARAARHPRVSRLLDPDLDVCHESRQGCSGSVLVLVASLDRGRRQCAVQVHVAVP